MEMEPADPGRVAARAVGRTPEEHAAIEHMLARRRAKRAARSQQYQQHDNHRQIQKQEHQQHAQPRRTQQVPPSTSAAAAAAVNDVPGATSGAAKLALYHLCRLKQEYHQRRDASIEIKHELETAIQRIENHLLGSTRVPEQLPSMPQHSMMDDSPYHSSDHHSSESASDDSDSDMDAITYLEPPGSTRELVAIRTIIRTEPMLSDLSKIILLLVTQIPPGCFTTYSNIHQHLLSVWGECDVRQIGQVLTENPFTNYIVPCHRVVGSWGRLGPSAKPQLLDFGMHCQDIEDTYDRLRDEGVKFYDNGAPIGDPFSDFWGCPRI
ncbi:hypothetical protein M434DRAFT_398464 [Hypoxylon sp. CO27-5]|nr:hypothetical protein M434DRAFT_398464 [Hypoxylon sp. CO27-5]